MRKFSIVASACFGLFTGCASVVSTNETARVSVPSIASTDSLADIEVKELVKGQGCVTKTLGLLDSGDKKFMSANGSIGLSAVERAKAAATYNALSKDGLTTDILVNPVWEIQENHSFFVNDVCARVIGYRGVIKGFKQLKTITRASGYRTTTDYPMDNRGISSHFSADEDELELEREVIIHEQAQPASKSGEFKGEGSKEVATRSAMKIHDDPKELEVKHEALKYAEPKHAEPKHEREGHSDEKSGKKSNSKKED